MQPRFRISYRNIQPPQMYTDLKMQVTLFAKNTAFRWSFNGVPHLLVELGRNTVYSLCYFKKRKSWRVFYPYGTGNQTRVDFQSTEDLIKFLKKHRPRSVRETVNA